MAGHDRQGTPWDRTRRAHVSLSVCPPLPGKAAHAEMLPMARRCPFLTESTPRNALEASVMMVLFPVNIGEDRSHLLDWKVLLILRNVYEGAHSGQVAFPGGKREPGENLWQTACRETREEVGIPADKLRHAGSLSCVYISASNFVVYPFVAVADRDCVIRPDSREVAGYTTVPLRAFNPGAALLPEGKASSGAETEHPVWRYGEYTVWGATAMMLAELYRLIEGGGLVCVSEELYD